MQNIPITNQGITALREELADLKKNKRPEVIEAIAEARAHGDLKENAEYHAAREQQGFIEGRIKELEGVIGASLVIDVASLDAGDKVVFGATVEIMHLDNEERVTYQIVGEYEADIDNHKISVTSPLARSLIGHSLGDVIVVNAPAGDQEYEILQVTYS